MVVILWPVAPGGFSAECRDGEQHGDAIFPAVDQLGHAAGQAYIGDLGNTDLAGDAGVAVGHGNDGAFLNAFDELDFRHVNQRIIDRSVTGRWIEKDEFRAGGFELLDIELAAGAGNLADRSAAGRLRHRGAWRYRLDDCSGRGGGQSGGTEAAHEIAP